jgi:hypothetical protein
LNVLPKWPFCFLLSGVLDSSSELFGSSSCIV